MAVVRQQMLPSEKDSTTYPWHGYKWAFTNIATVECLGGIIFFCLPLPLASGSLRDLRLFADATVLWPSNVLLSITIQPSKI